MNTSLKKLALVVVSVVISALAGTAAADIIRVTITGDVERNDFKDNATRTFYSCGAPYPAPATPADPVFLQFDLDSTHYLDSAALPGRCRGYNLVEGSFIFHVGAISAPLNRTATNGYYNGAYFVIRNNDPGVDGFFLSQGTDIDTEIPLVMNPNGYGVAFLRTFNGSTTLPSVNVLDAVGTWLAYNNLSVFNFTIEHGEFSVPMIYTMGSITVANITPHKCQPADIADDQGNPLPSAGTNGGVNEGDYNAFFQGFFDAAPQCDIADDSGNPLPPFGAAGGTNGGVNEGDYNCFFQNFFNGCP